MKRRITILSALVLAAPMVLASAAAYAADGADYGQHAAECAQHMDGFSGDHNPGTHKGYADWDGHHCHH